MGYFEPSKFTIDPDTGTWGLTEEGIEWYNSTDGRKRQWNGSSIIQFTYVGEVSAPSYVFSSGWEDSGGSDATDGGLWTGTNESPGISSGTVHTDNYALLVNSDYEYVYKSITSTTDIYVAAWIKFDVTPTSGAECYFMQLLNGSSVVLRLQLIDSSGTDKWARVCSSVSTTNYAQSNTATNPGTIWTHIEMRASVGVSNTNYQVWVNETELSDIAASGFAPQSGCQAINRLEVGKWYTSGNMTSSTIYYDDVIYNDSYIGSVSL